MMCSHFLPATDKDFHNLCSVWHDQHYSFDLRLSGLVNIAMGKVHSHIDKLAEQPKRKKWKAQSMWSSSFSGFSSPPAVPLMVTSLSSKLSPSRISPSSWFGIFVMIVTSTSMISPALASTLAITNPVRANSHYAVHLCKAFICKLFLYRNQWGC